MTRSSRWTAWGIGLVLVFLVASCVSPRGRGGERPHRPVWSPEAFERHLQVINRAPGERITGSRAYQRAAEYTAGRLRAYELQPGLERGFLLPYSMPPDSSFALQVIAPSDPDAFVTGVDVLRHAQTDEGRVEAESASIVPRSVVPSSVRRIVLTQAEGAASLRELRQAGARAVLQVGALTPRSYRSPVQGLIVAQITPDAAQRMLRVTQTQLARYLAGDEVITWGMPQPIRIRVRATVREREEEAVNVLGYVAGRHPEDMKEAILVCADLDALGDVGGVPTRDFQSFGVDVAALLEAVRNVALVAPAARAMKRSLIVAVWSGSQQGHQGLRAYLRSPLWPLEKTRAVYYVGLSGDDKSDVQSILKGHNIPMHAIEQPGEPLFLPSRYLTPSDERRDRAIEAPSPPNPNMGAVVGRGAEMARQLSETTFQILLGALSTPGSFAPARADTLPYPGMPRTIRDD